MTKKSLKSYIFNLFLSCGSLLSDTGLSPMTAEEGGLVGYVLCCTNLLYINQL